VFRLGPEPFNSNSNSKDHQQCVLGFTWPWTAIQPLASSLFWRLLRCLRACAWCLAASCVWLPDMLRVLVRLAGCPWIVPHVIRCVSLMWAGSLAVVASHPRPR